MDQPALSPAMEQGDVIALSDRPAEIQQLALEMNRLQRELDEAHTRLDLQMRATRILLIPLHELDAR
jgi:hypothetical protein